MKPFRDFILKAEFIDDLAEALDWYGARREKLSDELFSDVQIILKHIESYPESFSIQKKNYRQAVLSRFPYVIVYKIYHTEISVSAFFHTSRNPGKKFRRK